MSMATGSGLNSNPPNNPDTIVEEKSIYYFRSYRGNWQALEEYNLLIHGDSAYIELELFKRDCFKIADAFWHKYYEYGDIENMACFSTDQDKNFVVEAIKIELTGEIAKYFDIYYRTHCENYGWLGWAKNGEKAGTAGYAYRLEGIEKVEISKKTYSKLEDTIKYIKSEWSDDLLIPQIIIYDKKQSEIFPTVFGVEFSILKLT